MEKYGNISDYELFSIYRAKFKKEADICYKKYLDTKENNVASNVKAFWFYISKRKTSNSIPSTVFFQQLSSHDPSSTCNPFTKFFQSEVESNVEGSYLLHSILLLRNLRPKS